MKRFGQQPCRSSENTRAENQPGAVSSGLVKRASLERKRQQQAYHNQENIELLQRVIARVATL